MLFERNLQYTCILAVGVLASECLKSEESYWSRLECFARTSLLDSVIVVSLIMICGYLAKNHEKIISESTCNTQKKSQNVMPDVSLFQENEEEAPVLNEQFPQLDTFEEFVILNNNEGNAVGLGRNPSLLDL